MAPISYINLNAIKHNYDVLSSITNAKICAVIKADAYGHGLVEVAKALNKSDYFGVARAEEALLLRKSNIKNKILLMDKPQVKFAQKLIDNGITFTVHSLEDFNLLQSVSAHSNKSFYIHIKIDSGMHRLGISDEKELQEIMNALDSSKNIIFESFYTHYATSDSDEEYLNEQYNNFCHLTAPYKSLKHSANSSAILIGQKYHMDMVRAGIMLYGYVDQNKNTTKNNYNAIENLKPAMTIKTDIMQIKMLDEGQFVGYGKGYMTKRKTKIAVISIGYGDGYPRLINQGYVIINNKQCNILGKVCMDLTAVDITDAGLVTLDDKAVILGEDLRANILANWNNTISYDILCGFTQRIKRIWID